MMEPKDLVTHACEQALRFSSVANWHDLSEERKVQLGFNMGIIALGLNLSKDDGYMVMWKAREGLISMPTMREHVAILVKKHEIPVDAERIDKSF
jgi:hypothetical protein